MPTVEALIEAALTVLPAETPILLDRYVTCNISDMGGAPYKFGKKLMCTLSSVNFCKKIESGHSFDKLLWYRYIHWLKKAEP